MGAVNAETPLLLKADLKRSWSSMICPGERPEKRAQTLRKLKAVECGIPVQGRERVQRDAAYVELLIETVESIVRQRANLPDWGPSHEDAQEKFGFFGVQASMNPGDELHAPWFDAWFAQHFAVAAFKE